MLPWSRTRVVAKQASVRSIEGGRCVSNGICCWAWATCKWVRAMGGGPRTYPGGVTKWQWKRMLVKRREERQQLRLSREKVFFEMRQRAELLSAHLEPQQPWEKLAVCPPPGICTGQQVASVVRHKKPSQTQQVTAPSCLDAEPPNATLPPSGQDQHPPSRPRTSPSSCLDAESSNIKSFFGEANHSPLQPLPFSVCWLTMGTPTSKKKNKDIGKSMRDYLDAFDADPLGVTLEAHKSKSKKDVRRDPVGLSVNSKETAKSEGSLKKNPGKGVRKNRGR
ncbi:hypothetical protein GOP47_0016122 [Adiantum capillus-veneris]|uniref:Uncharacterized protein n=1 Tax=Adiantum capillus-veneris TaxID=13818 RepID=A0A9D4ZEL6_ADICA|nr:hypothetical protein GOP47_0016122 [Adiantum capillus-veneris]